MNNVVLTWLLLFLASIGAIVLLTDVVYLLARLGSKSGSILYKIWKAHPMRHFKCWLICKHRGIDFRNFKLVFNYDYKAIGDYLKKNRRR